VYVTMCFFSLLLCDMRPFLPSCIPKILPLVWVHSRVLRANWRDSPACQELAYCPSQNPMCSAPPPPAPYCTQHQNCCRLNWTQLLMTSTCLPTTSSLSWIRLKRQTHILRLCHPISKGNIF
jgi:hypothetical protein